MFFHSINVAESWPVAQRERGMWSNVARYEFVRGVLTADAAKAARQRSKLHEQDWARAQQPSLLDGIDARLELLT
jgi:hypothetical protein